MGVRTRFQINVPIYPDRIFWYDLTNHSRGIGQVSHTFQVFETSKAGHHPTVLVQRQRSRGSWNERLFVYEHYRLPDYWIRSNVRGAPDRGLLTDHSHWLHVQTSSEICKSAFALSEADDKHAFLILG